MKRCKKKRKRHRQYCRHDYDDDDRPAIAWITSTKEPQMVEELVRNQLYQDNTKITQPTLVTKQ